MAEAEKFLSKPCLQSLLLGFAVLAEIVGSYWMKHAMCFRSLKSVVCAAVAIFMCTTFTFLLLQMTALTVAWALFTQLEVIGTIALGIIVFKETISAQNSAFIALGMLGISQLELQSDRSDRIGRIAALSSLKVELAAGFFAVFAMCSVLAVSKRVRWADSTTLGLVKFASLCTAVLFEILAAIFMYCGSYVTSLLCSWACGAAIILLLDYLDLAIGWALLTGLECAGVEIVAILYFREPLSMQASLGLLAVFASAVGLQLEDSVFFEHISPCKPSLLQYVRRRIQAAKAKGTGNPQDPGRVVVLVGGGAVGKLVLQKLLSDFDFALVVLLDLVRVSIANLPDRSARAFVQLPHAIIASDFDKMLGSIGLTAGDVVIELGHRISTLALAKWCHELGLHMVNAHASEWGCLDDFVPLDEQIQGIVAGIQHLAGHGPTSVLLHGMNPGLVSYMVQKAIFDLGQRQGLRLDAGLSKERQIASMAKQLGVMAVDVTEIDTQASHIDPGEFDFVSTWSCVSFFEEVAKCESITHHTGLGAQRSGSLPLETEGRSVALGHDGLQAFSGFVVAHEEVHTIPKMLGESDDVTVRFVYRPSQQMMDSLERSKHLSTSRMSGCRNLLVIGDDGVEEGFDSVGALVRTGDGKGQWCGVKMSAGEAMALTGGQGNATSWLTAWGVLIGLRLCLRQPSQGVCLPEDIAFDEAMAHLEGRIISQPVDMPVTELTAAEQPPHAPTITNLMGLLQ